MWSQLDNKGILQGQLINHVWSKFEAEDRLQFLNVMEQFDLICVAPRVEETQVKHPWEHTETKSHSSTPIHRRTYYVPSLFKPGNVKQESDSEYWASLTFFVDIHGLFTSEDLILAVLNLHSHFTMISRDMFNVKLHNVALRDTIVYDVHVVDEIQSTLDTSNILVPFDMKTCKD